MSEELLKKISEILGCEVVEVEKSNAELIDDSGRYFDDYCIENLDDEITFYVTEKLGDTWYAHGYIKAI